MSKKKRAQPATSRPHGSGLRSVYYQVAFAALLAGLVFVVLVASRAVRGQTSGGPGPSAERAMKPIDGVHCDAGEQLAYHVHAHLTILAKGKPVTVPALIGIPSDSCLYWLHTHDDSGVIHIEAPKRYVPVLGEFFDIWGEPLSPSRAAAARAAATHLVRTYVDGKVYHGNPRSIPLHDHTDITIEVGPPFKAPTRYDFSGNGY